MSYVCPNTNGTLAMEYWHYSPVSIWKTEAKKRGLRWQDVRDAYEEIRAVHREYKSQILQLRRRAFTESGVSKAHRAFWHADYDMSSIRGFDVLAEEISEEIKDLS